MNNSEISRSEITDGASWNYWHKTNHANPKAPHITVTYHVSSRMESGHPEYFNVYHCKTCKRSYCFICGSETDFDIKEILAGKTTHNGPHFTLKKEWLAEPKSVESEYQNMEVFFSG